MTNIDNKKILKKAAKDSELIKDVALKCNLSHEELIKTLRTLPQSMYNYLRNTMCYKILYI